MRLTYSVTRVVSQTQSHYTVTSCLTAGYEKPSQDMEKLPQKNRELQSHWPARKHGTRIKQHHFKRKGIMLPVTRMLFQKTVHMLTGAVIA